MRLVAIQPRFVYEHLAAGGTFHAQPRKDREHWLNEHEGPLVAYEWLCQRMQERGMARPAADVYPIWAWYQWGGHKRRHPDLRTSQMKHWSDEERMVELLLEIPDDEVLLSDYEAWHFALNYWYLGRPRATQDFTRRCKAKGLSYYRSKPLPDSQLHEELQGSWNQILDMRAACAVLRSRLRDQVIQATFWTLEPRHVLRAREFGAGAPLQHLALPRSR